MATLFYRTKHNYRRTGGSPVPGASQTIQGEVKSIAYHLQRALEGYPMPRKDVIYFDEEDINRISAYHAPQSLDFTDLEALQFSIDKLQTTLDEAKKNQKPEPVEPEEPTEE